MTPIGSINPKALEHQAELDRNTKYLSVADLMKRWGCSRTTVRAIPKSRLPYRNFGQGLKRERPRYLEADVYAYEAWLLEQAAA